MATIKLKLVDNQGTTQLWWSPDGYSWGKVDGSYPMTGLNEGDSIDWEADDSINQVQIHFKGGNIIPNSGVNGNGSKNPNARVPTGISQPQQDTYTIKVQPAGGGALQEYDPGLTIPPQ